MNGKESRMKLLKPIPKCNFKSLQKLFNDEKRWIKCKLANEEETACCLLGGLRYIYPKNSTEIEYKLLITIQKLYPRQYPVTSILNVNTFNDHPDTTIKDIRKVIKAAGV